MRAASLCLALLSATTAGAMPWPAAPLPPVVVESPVGQLRLAVMDLAVRVSPTDAPFTRYVSFAWPPPGMTRSEFRRAFRVELNKKNAGTVIVPEVEVDGPNGTVERSKECTLVRLRICDAVNWTRAAWVLVADRDYLFREAPFGLLPHRETQFGRLVTGIDQNEKTLAAGFLLNGAQLFRDMMELARSQTGHDLLYAAERHPDPDGGRVDFKAVGGAFAAYDADVNIQRASLGDDHGQLVAYLDRGVRVRVIGYESGDSGNRLAKVQTPGGREGYVRLGELTRIGEAPKAATTTLIPVRPISVRDAGKGKADFPATLDEFQGRWGVRKREEKLKVFLFDPAVGGIALGADSDTNGSTVAAGGDRVVKIDGTEFGAAFTTFDSFESVDGNDQIERDQFLNITKGVVKFDGGEALAAIPLGAQAEFLFNAEKKSVNIADTRLAKHLEGKSSDPRFPDVRVGFCASCHAQSYGYNPFVEQFADSKAKGIRFNVKAEDAADVRSFYEGWQRRVKRWRLPYEEFVEATTADPLTGKPWTGGQMWAALMKARDAYDRPVGIEEAAREFGWRTEDLRKAILGVREGDEPPDTRLAQLAVGKVVPRLTWQKNVATKLSLWLDLKTPTSEPLKAALAPAFLEDALRRFGHEGKLKP